MQYTKYFSFANIISIYFFEKCQKSETTYER